MKRNKVAFTKSGKQVVHGSPSSYNNHKCRCKECTDAWAKYIASLGTVDRYRAKKRKKGVTINL